MSRRITGYGKGWQEPLARGRWARWRQKSREPMTKDDTWFWLCIFPVVALSLGYVAFAVI